MTEAIVSTVVQTLGGLLAAELNLLSGVTNQVQEVSRELKRIQCFLRDADTRDYKDETIRNWLREIKSFTYRVEDIVEMFAVEVASKRENGVMKAMKRFACIFCESRSLHKLGLEISSVKNDISNLTLSLQTYNVKAISEAGTSGGSTEVNDKWTRQTYAHEIEEYFVGMEDDIRKLVSLVVDEQKHHPIISVWGMGGLGKTTIARKIYHQRDVRRRFQLFAWVCITQQGQTRSILQDILMQFSPEKEEEIKRMEDRQLVERLYRVQIENKCLVVLDDIWYLRDWENLVHAFPIVQGAGSKILLTTRMKEVAEIGIPHELRCLDDKESWELLKVIAFSRRNVQDMKIEPKLEAVGIEMAGKCNGLPLAICVLGGILKDMNSLKDWKIVYSNIDSYLSAGKDSEEGSGRGGVVPRVLSLSYNALPYHLKPCFLYLGSYQEDVEIKTEQLYQLWIAEGMVSSQHQRRSGETLMEVAERYLNELGRRSMVQVHVDEFSMYRRFDWCRLHDMMRDFCLKKGREEEFVRVIDLRGVKKSFSPINNSAYRLVIHSDYNPNEHAKAKSVLEDYKQIRSLLVHNNDNFWLRDKKIMGFKTIKFICENLRLLRVLKFERYNFEGKKMPKGVEKLIHLRLLSFRDCNLVRIPSSIAKLPLLETLDLGGFNCIKMPNFLGKMKRLRHLYLCKLIPEIKEKVRLSGLSELETLHGFHSDRDEVADLHELTNLRSLEADVTENESVYTLINYISDNAPNLLETALTLRISVSFDSEEGGSFLLRKILECGKIHHLEIWVRISKFPRYEEHFLLGLVRLELAYTFIEEDPMETLEKLPQLRSLVFGNESYLGTDLICQELGFPQLRHLIFDDLPNLHIWKVENGGMPNLSRLEIIDCSELEMIPEGMKDVTGLKELVIKNMPSTFVDRIRVRDGQEGEDFHKIQHVPSITIWSLR